MAIALNTRDGRTIAVPAWAILLALSVVVVVPVLGLRGTTVFLRPSVVLQFPVIFAWTSLAGAGALLWTKRGGLAQAGRSRPLAIRLLQVAVGTGAAGLAFGAIATFACLLAVQQQVRLAAGTPVEFTSRIVRTDKARGCARTIVFANEPLQSDSSVCADAFPIRNAAPGEWILVREKVGQLGVHVTSIRSADPPR